jgi:hypothetical protein
MSKPKLKSLAQISYEANRMDEVYGPWPGRYESVRWAHETSAKAVEKEVIRHLRRLNRNLKTA